MYHFYLYIYLFGEFKNVNRFKSVGYIYTVENSFTMKTYFSILMLRIAWSGKYKQKKQTWIKDYQQKSKQSSVICLPVVPIHFNEGRKNIS